MGAASRRGILVSEARVLETISKPDAVILDKTGTVKDSEFSLLDVASKPEALVTGLELSQVVTELSPQYVSVRGLIATGWSEYRLQSSIFLANEEPN